MTSTPSSRAGRLGDLVIRRANEATIGLSSELVAMNSSPNGTLRMRLRPCPQKVDGSGDVDDDVQALARERIALELARTMPLSSCCHRHSMVDGRDELELRIPGNREAWSVARARAARAGSARLLCVGAMLLLLATVALIAVPLVRARG